MTLGLYLTRIVGLRIVAAGIILLLLGLGIDLMRMAAGLIERGGLPAVAEYAWLRAPLIGTTLFPIAVLTGAVIGFLSLASRSELTVVRSAGQSTFRMLRALAPMALILGFFYSLLGDQLTSWAENGLTEMFPLDVRVEADIGSPIWSRYADEVVRAYPDDPDGTALLQLTIYRLDPAGHVRERLTAVSARWDGQGWTLHGTETIVDGQPVRHGKMDWPTQLSPADVQALAAGRQSVSVSNARAVLAGDALPTRGRAYYATRIARSYVAFAVPAIMLILAALAGYGSARSGGGVRLAVLAVALGFLYIAVDGFFASMGEVGAMAPLTAAIAPSVLFAIVGIWILMVIET